MAETDYGRNVGEVFAAAEAVTGPFRNARQCDPGVSANRLVIGRPFGLTILPIGAQLAPARTNDQHGQTGASLWRLPRSERFAVRDKSYGRGGFAVAVVRDFNLIDEPGEQLHGMAFTVGFSHQLEDCCDGGSGGDADSGNAEISGIAWHAASRPHLGHDRRVEFGLEARDALQVVHAGQI